MIGEYLYGYYLGYWVIVSYVWYLDVEVEDLIVFMVMVWFLCVVMGVAVICFD